MVTGFSNSKGYLSDIVDIILKNIDENLLSKAELAVNSMRYVLIHKDPIVFVFLGEHGDHLVVGGTYCTCQAFQSTMLRGNPICYHIIGSWIALSKEKYHDLSDWISYELFVKIINEILNYDFSKTLRKIMFKNSKG